MFLTCLLAFVLSSHVYAQYQKMARASSINLSAAASYANLGWSKQLSNKTNLAISGSYFQDEANSITSDNFSANLGLSRWLFRIGDAYISGGVGGFVAHTHAESAADTEDNDVSFGIDLRGELEFYPTWWLVLFGEVKQMEFFTSDFLNRKFIVGGGVKIVF